MVSKILGACACVALSIGLPPSARADVVTDWNATAITVARAAGDPVILRTLAMVHIAIFDAVNSVDYRYREYAVRLPAAGASREAAAAAAAYGILIRRFPSQQTALDAAVQASMAAIPDGSAKDAGRTLGDAVAALIHQLRSADGMNPPNNPPYSSRYRTGRVSADRPTTREHRRGHLPAVRDDERLAVPPERSTGTPHQAVRARPRGRSTARDVDRRTPDSPAGSHRELAHRDGTVPVVAHRARRRDRGFVRSADERSPVRAAQHRSGGRLHRGLRSEVTTSIFGGR